MGRKASRYTATTPRAITNAIRDFAEDLGTTGEVVYVPINPMPWAQDGWCYLNCALAGCGTPVIGWTIWNCRDLYLCAEHHCVLLQDDGTYLDVTPAMGSRRCLFAPTGQTVTNGDWEVVNSHLESIQRNGSGGQYQILVEDRRVKQAVEILKEASIRQWEERKREAETGIPVSVAADHRHNASMDRIEALLDEYFESQGKPSRKVLRKLKKVGRQRRKAGRKR